MEAEHAALARRALHGDLAAQQLRQVARNRQAQARAAVLAVGAAIGLLECFKNQLLLVFGNADAGVVHRKCQGAGLVLRQLQVHAAPVRELDRVGQQVLQNLAQALAIGLRVGRHAGCNMAGQRQPLLLGHRAQRLDQRLHRRGQIDRLQHHGRLAGLDLGQVQNVVDQCQQVVAGRVDRVRILDLLGRQVARLVVAQQLGQDQRGIQRRAQLVAHVGQELALVLAGHFQLARLVGQCILGAQQLLALVLQLLRLLFQVGIGLLQLRLLLLHLRLRALQRLALLLQLLIAGAHFLLLHQQLFRLLARLFQQFLQARAVQRRAHCNRQDRRRAFEQLQLRLRGRPHKAQLDQRMHLAVLDGRRQHQLQRLRLPGAGADLQMALVEPTHPQQLAAAQHLPGQAFASQQMLLQCILGQRIAAKQLVAVIHAMARIAGAHLGARVRRQKIQRPRAHFFEAMVALQPLAGAMRRWRWCGPTRASR